MRIHIKYVLLNFGILGNGDKLTPKVALMKRSSCLQAKRCHSPGHVTMSEWCKAVPEPGG